MRILRRLVFAGLNVFVVGAYCYAMVGRLEPLEHHPTRFVIVPLMVITAVVCLFLFPWMCRQQSRLGQALLLYLGFALTAAIYGVLLWIQFPDGSVFSVPLALIGAHLYGFPAFLVALVCNLLLARWLFRSATSR